MRATLAAADVYASSSVGDIVNEPAMLSKPLAASSGGRSVVASISRSRRSRMTLAYSVRFRRWSTTPPGFTWPNALRSISFSSQSRSPSYSANAGRRMPGGGITPARSLRTTFSHNCGLSPTVARSNFSSVRLALFVLSLWQVTQY